jgi:hypothetical protein
MPTNIKKIQLSKKNYENGSINIVIWEEVENSPNASRVAHYTLLGNTELNKKIIALLEEDAAEREGFF